MTEKNRPYMKTVLTLLAVAMFAVVCFSLTSQPHYTRFTEKRTAKMENRFSIEVMDNIRLCEYEMSEYPAYGESKKRPEFKYSLFLEADDPEKFMTENVTGIINGKYDNMNFSYKNSDNQ